MANAFQPALREFEKTYASKGIRSFMVYCSPKLKTQEIAKHVKDFGIRMPAIHDADQSIGKLTRARVTPEAIVIDRSGTIRYRGMINNLYAGYGKKRAKATRHYLRDACDAIAMNKEVATTTTKPLGCFIHYQTKPPARSKSPRDS